MQTPGFSAEASLYQTNRRYMLQSLETGQNVVVPSLKRVDCDYLDGLCDFQGGGGPICELRDKVCGPYPLPWFQPW